MPKHVLLGMTLRHLTGSAEIITLINRYGHCQSYSQVMELETAMCNAIEIRNSVLPSNISMTANKMINMCWDNFDINEETASGAETTHTTHGIVIQELMTDMPITLPSLDSIPRTKERSVKYTLPSLPPCFSHKRVEPSVTSPCHNQISISEMHCADMKFEMSWVICRGQYNPNSTVPEWSGWISKMEVVPKFHKQSVIGYMEPILYPITLIIPRCNSV